MASTYISQHGTGPLMVYVFGIGGDDIEASDNRQSPDWVSLRIGPHLSVVGPLADLRQAGTDMLNALAAISVRRIASERASAAASAMTSADFTDACDWGPG